MLERPATIKEILSVITKNHLYDFNTSDKEGVLRNQIQRRCTYYSKSGASEVKYFKKIEDNKYDLLAEPEVEVNKEALGKPQEWLVKRDEYVNQVKYHLKRKQLSLFLGAGVSKSAQLPDWKTLISKLNLEVIKKISKEKNKWAIGDKKLSLKEQEMLTEVLTHLKADGSTISNAHFFELTLADQKKHLSSYIRAALYKNSSKVYGSPLLEWIAKLCVPQNEYRIRSVITFNFDDLLEQYLRKYMVKPRAVFKEDVEISPKHLPIYHVHGFLPQRDITHDKEEGNLIVFSEKAYHTVYTDAYSWSNIIQLYTLKENVCLFIGISFTDPNMRRLLDISTRRNDKVKHYALMERKDLENAEELLEDAEALVGKDLMAKENKRSAELLASLLEDAHLFKELEFQRMGIQIIWYNNHDEIPGILEEIIGVD